MAILFFQRGRVGLFTEKFTREPCPSFIQTGNRSKPHEQYKNHPHSPVLQRQVRTYYNTQYNHPFHTLADASRPASQQLFGQISPKSLLPVPHRSSSNENWSHTATTMTSTARHRDAVNNQHIKYEICVFIFSREIQFGTTRRTVNLYSQQSIVYNSNLSWCMCTKFTFLSTKMIHKMQLQTVKMFIDFLVWLTLLSKNTKSCPLCKRVSNFPLKCRKQTWSYHTTKSDFEAGPRTTKKVWVCFTELESKRYAR